MLLFGPWEMVPGGSFVNLFMFVFLVFMLSKYIVNEFRSNGWKMFKTWQNSVVGVILILLIAGTFWFIVVLVQELM